MKLIFWEKLKQQSMFVANKFDKYHKQHNKLKTCGRFITTNIFENIESKEYKTKTHNDTFCKSKFCYVCEKIKSSKYQIGLEKKLTESVKNKNYIDFLTLTVPNCDLDELDETLKNLASQFKKLRDNLKKSYGAIGFFKAVEITYTDKVNIEDLTDEQLVEYSNEIEFEKKYNFRTKKHYIEIPKMKDGKKQAHPHYHLLIVYDKFDMDKNPDYLTYKTLWKRLINGSVFVKKFKTKNIKKSIQEMTKYLTKETEYKYFTPDEMALIDKQLHKKQFYGKGGVLDFKVKKISNEMNEESRQEEIDLFDKTKNKYIGRIKYRFVKNHYWKYKEDWLISEKEQLQVKEFLTNEDNYPKNLFHIENEDYQEKFKLLA